MNKLKQLIDHTVRLILCALPWSLRRPLLTNLYGYRFAEGAYISTFSWVFPRVLIMESHSKIGPFNIAIHLDCVVLKESATIGRGNWITGYSTKLNAHFSHRSARDSSLILGRHSAITKSHHIDCTDRIEIGDFTTVAGYRSQLLTHSIDIYKNQQDCKPITIGNYCFIGTNSIILGGATLPNRSVLGAASVLNKAFEDDYHLYAGNPAKQIKPIEPDAKYFSRTQGFVN